MIISVANQKGGVGKTTTAVTLSHALARSGRRVLLVDLDPQGHVAFSLGLDKAPDVYRLLAESAPLASVATPARENLDAILSDKQTEAAKRYVTTLNFRERVLVNALDGADYDAILLDLPPSLDVLHVAALLASDFVLIPTKLDALAIDGVNEILLSIAEVVQAGHQLAGWAILPTFFDRTTKETAQQLTDLVKAFPKNTWPPIPTDTKAREATAYGQTVWEYSPKTPAALGYSSNGKSLGGYVTTVKKLLEVMDGR